MPAVTLHAAIALAAFALAQATQFETRLGNPTHRHTSATDRIEVLAGRVERHLAAINDWIPRSALASDLGRPETRHFDAALDRLITAEKLHTRTAPSSGRPRTEYPLGTSRARKTSPVSRPNSPQ